MIAMFFEACDGGGEKPSLRGGYPLFLSGLLGIKVECKIMRMLHEKAIMKVIVCDLNEAFANAICRSLGGW